MIDDLLREHDGVLTLAQAQEAGLSQDAINRRLRSGRWQQRSRGVYFVADRPFTDAARIRAAVWGQGSSAAASGLAAAWWHGITKYPPKTVEVTIPRNAHRVRREGIRTRRRDLETVDVVERNGLRVTELGFTIVEAAVRRGGGVELMDTALQRHAELGQLWKAHLRNKGRHGSPRARRLLQAADDGARSAAERLLIRILKSAGITGWKANQPVVGYAVDVAFPRCHVAIEIDGYAFHSDANVFNNDRKRQNAIALAGWQVLRFTWLDLVEYPERVVAEIRRAICVP
jgi:very-short-patch-repair endonuclease